MGTTISAVQGDRAAVSLIVRTRHLRIGFHDLNPLLYLHPSPLEYSPLRLILSFQDSTCTTDLMMHTPQLLTCIAARLDPMTCALDGLKPAAIFWTNPISSRSIIPAPCCPDGLPLPLPIPRLAPDYLVNVIVVIDDVAAATPALFLLVLLLLLLPLLL